MPCKVNHLPSAPQTGALAATTTTGLQHLLNWPITFGITTPADAICNDATCCLYNLDITLAASMLALFNLAIYSFNSGHFLSTIHERSLPFKAVLSCDPFVYDHALFHKLSECKLILTSAPATLDHIRGSGITLKMAGYIIHSHWYTSTEPTSRFLDIQSNIMRQLCITQSLSIVIAFVHLDYNCRAVSLTFVKCLHADGWIINDTNISYPTFGDSILKGCQLFVGVCSNTEPTCQAFELKTMPSIPFLPLAHFIWAPFNTPEHTISYSKDDPSFNLHAVNDNSAPPLHASMPIPNQHASIEPGVNISYYLHRAQDNPNVLAGSLVTHQDSLCPTFDPTDNLNLLGHFFGIEFTHDSHVYVRAVSQFEIASCLHLLDEFTYKLSHPSHSFCLNASIPGLNSAGIFDQIHDQCMHIR
jgi:hypothetical protein